MSFTTPHKIDKLSKWSPLIFETTNENDYIKYTKIVSLYFCIEK